MVQETDNWIEFTKDLIAQHCKTTNKEYVLIFNNSKIIKSINLLMLFVDAKTILRNGYNAKSNEIIVEFDIDDIEHIVKFNDNIISIKENI